MVPCVWPKGMLTFIFHCIWSIILWSIQMCFNHFIHSYAWFIGFLYYSCPFGHTIQIHLSVISIHNMIILLHKCSCPYEDCILAKFCYCLLLVNNWLFGHPVDQSQMTLPWPSKICFFSFYHVSLPTPCFPWFLRGFVTWSISRSKHLLDQEPGPRSKTWSEHRTDQHLDLPNFFHF